MPNVRQGTATTPYSHPHQQAVSPRTTSDSRLPTIIDFVKILLDKEYSQVLRTLCSHDSRLSLFVDRHELSCHLGITFLALYDRTVYRCIRHPYTHRSGQHLYL
jgi:hypothetical protein